MRAAVAASHALAFILLPPPVARFQLRAYGLALLRRDRWSLRSATKPRELRMLVRLARGRARVVEIGTGTGWTAASLALADPRRGVLTLDPIRRPGRDAYLALCAPAARSRVELAGADPPAAGEPIDLLFVDGSHGAASVIDAFRTWRPRLAPGAVVAFHDWANPAHPGVREAIETLGLAGRGAGDLYVWRAAR